MGLITDTNIACSVTYVYKQYGYTCTKYVRQMYKICGTSPFIFKMH